MSPSDGMYRGPKSLIVQEEAVSEDINLLGQVVPDFFFCQSADVIISRIHGDIAKVVQVTEYSDFAELGGMIYRACW